MATPIDIIGGFYTVSGRSWAAQDCVNYLPMAAEVSGTKTPTSLRTPPGLRPYVEIGDGPEYAIRGGHDVEGRRFVVAGQRLYQISNTGIAIPLGTVPGVGRVSMAHNQIAGGNELLVVNGSAGYVWNTLKQTFKRVTDPGYPGAFLADFVDSYLMQVEPFGRYLFHSDLANANDYNTLDRFEAEAEPDRIVSMLVDHGEVWAFGVRTIQLFQNTGAAQGTFQPKGITIEQGCAGRFTPAKLDNSVFWLGNDGIFYRADGYSPMRISTHAIEDAIADCDWSQAFAFTWASKGHKVYYCTFPDGQTWGYDVSSRLWHRRASYHPVHEVARRWRLSDLFYSNGEWIGCDSTSGKLFILDWDYMLEGEAEPLVSERTTQMAYSAGRGFSVDMLELEMLTGQKATVPGSVVFPTQPEGPKISGDPPGGAIGLAYGSYQYTATPGSSSVLRFSSPNGLPDGFSLSASGVLSAGVQTRIAKYKVTVRVTDGNGLFDEIENEISITYVSFATSPLLAPGHVMVSKTGEQWGGDINTTLPGAISMLKAMGGRVFAFGENSVGRVSADFGQTWLPTSGVVPPYVGDPPRGMIYSDGVWVLFFRDGQSVARSTDGISFTTVPLSTNRSWYTGSAIGKTFMLYGTNGSAERSVDGGLTWESVIVGGVVLDPSTVSNGKFFVFSSGNLWVSATGATGSWSPRPFPGVAFVKNYLIALNGRILLTAGTDPYYTDNEGASWVQGNPFTSGISGQAPDNNIVHNGIRFIVGLDRTIDISDDGVQWSKAFETANSGTFKVASLGQFADE